MLKIFDPSLYGAVQAQSCASIQSVPTQNSCHVSLKGVYSQCLRLEMQEVQDVLHKCANGILTPHYTS